MAGPEGLINRLQARISSIESELSELKAHLSSLENEEKEERDDKHPLVLNHEDQQIAAPPRDAYSWPLEKSEYQRYGRQMIMPEIGLEGQLSLKKSKILIVGVGGLGCPAATYLAGAGVGGLGFVDDDRISLSNLHRQTLYTEGSVGEGKVEQAVRNLRQSNSTIDYRQYRVRLTAPEAIELFADYDLILDCTDHPSSRYFISDVAVLTGKPLISASALRTEGQLMVLNTPPKDGKAFCYRCVFPKPPPPGSITTCGEGGVLGPVVGVMGVLMAMEAIKILTSPSTHSNAIETHPSLLLYSAYNSPPFRSIRLKGKRADCISCSDTATITRESILSGSLDYIAFCGLPQNPNVLPEHERTSPQDYAHLREDRSLSCTLIDVREPVEFAIGHIPESINIPFSMINRNAETSVDKLIETLHINPPPSGVNVQLHFICKLGNDSQLTVAKLREVPRFRDDERWECKGDIKGGLWQWKEQIDPSFPDYGGFPAPPAAGD